MPKWKLYNTMILIALCLAVFLSTPVGHAAANPVESQTVQITYKGKTFKVQTVYIDLSDPSIEVAAVAAEEGIGKVESFASIIRRENALAGINGTFFNAYEKDSSRRYPNGALLQDGRLLHSGENQTLYIGTNNKPHIEMVNFSTELHIQNEHNTYMLKPWGVNKYYGDTNNKQIVWYTPDFGSSISFTDGTKVIVENGKITRITDATVSVPKNGGVIYIGSSDSNSTARSRLKVGASVTPVVKAASGQTELNPQTLLAAIGVGPKLVTQGKADIDYKRDFFSDPKITQAAGARSFIGIDQQDRLVMGTVPSATISELAGIALELKLKEAMNMDGGASSALYANGRMLTTPGRELSNALIVRKRSEPQPVSLSINGANIDDFQGYLQKNTTMVPVRPFITALNAQFQWDPALRTAIIGVDGTEIILKDGASQAVINGQTIPVNEPLTILADQRMYAPLRFIAEALGAEVNWDAASFRAEIRLP